MIGLSEVSKNRIGKTFGTWKVLDALKKSVNHDTHYVCECIKCGNIVNKFVTRLLAEKGCSGCKFIPDKGRYLFSRYSKIKKEGWSNFKEFVDWFESLVDKDRFYPVLNRYDSSKPHSPVNSYIAYPFEIDFKEGDVVFDYLIISHLNKGEASAPKCKIECRECGEQKDILYKRIRTYKCDCKKIDVKNSPMYSTWYGMLYRCNDKRDSSYHNYGGRGISVCKEWYDFLVFKKFCLENGYAPGLQIDRKDNNGNYEPSNCRFVTNKINSRNRRTTVLTQELVNEIRFGKYKDMTSSQISKLITASPKTIRDVQQGKSWL